MRAASDTDMDFYRHYHLHQHRIPSADLDDYLDAGSIAELDGDGHYLTYSIGHAHWHINAFGHSLAHQHRHQ